MKMADRLGMDLVDAARAVTSKVDPSGDSKAAMKFIKGMEPGPREAVRRQMKKILTSEGSNDNLVLELQNQLASYLINKTQLTYGTVGMAKMGRFLGPVFSMFSTWPTNIASEVIYEYSRGGVTKGSVRAMRKLLAPALATVAIKHAIEKGTDTDLDESPRAKQLWSDPSPLYAAIDVVNFAKPPAFDIPARAAAAAYELATGNLDAAERKGKKTLEKMARTHIPVVSTLWNSFDRYYELLSNEKSPTKPDR
jgi:hypothetical protein